MMMVRMVSGRWVAGSGEGEGPSVSGAKSHVVFGPAAVAVVFVVTASAPLV